MKGCTVGGKSCSLPKDLSFENFNQKDLSDHVEVKVEAGKWISRLMADSLNGHTFLCHTLVPNVTVNFSKQNGNSISVKWNKKFLNKAPYWSIYVHDKMEHVLLQVNRHLPTGKLRNGQLRI